MASQLPSCYPSPERVIPGMVKPQLVATTNLLQHSVNNDFILYDLQPVTDPPERSIYVCLFPLPAHLFIEGSLWEEFQVQHLQCCFGSAVIAPALRG